MPAPMTYKAAGVDIALKQSLIPLFGSIAKSTAGAHVLGGIGGFGALVSLNGARRMRSPVLVAGTDSVGTKLLIAFKAGRHDTVGIDCVAMCVNDIVCHAARPMFFLDYIGAGKLDKKIALDIVRGVARGCNEAGMSLVGGETAQLSGLYKPGEYDLAGFAVGIVDRARIPQPAKVRAGDVLIGLASSGLHSNGFSLVRRVIFDRAKLKLSANVPELGCTLGEELLRPTLIYARVVVELFDRFKINGLANITGGGVIENVPRVMPSNAHAVFRRGSWPTPPIFELIQRLGKISRDEMDRTFNNGLGMVAIAPPREADRVLAHLKRRGFAGFVVGEVRTGKRGVSII
ncbi:MAG: phosphoribosylformylglycinamidine cyclo-ligase [Candidatus Binatus sp.]|uniref:phosphoribosylformylglycinamidine cyclo-ligase n=1 Tax=Candidatus Binatus sp. TaxID=2811406 RepID=UPI00271FFEC4|nr:phosphoribosylformylglycinamidine cyclo-ligase [Candidatus Binatus sp.]MDO8433788.1 phosphoribosylformylglycinamidine cyclo-ligase [Candidatus Binatus sp.]